MPIEKRVLPNGVRVLVERAPHVQSAAIGLWCRTGSRHERPGEEGITHLIEHMLFKGTKHRSAKQIAEDIEGRGGMLNAFTDKEQTCYYCRVLADDVAVGVDVLADMMVHSLLDTDELAREKHVVLEEIKRGEDEPGDHVHELHLQYRWGDHPLGKPIIGTKESVSSFSRDDLTRYVGRRYRAENVVLAVAGNVDPDAFRALAEEKLADFVASEPEDTVSRPVGVAGKHEVAKDVEQVHFCIGTDSCSVYDDDLYVAAVLDGVLGSGMSSRLFQEIREKRGLAYAIGSYNLAYTSGGAFTVYGGTGLETWNQVQSLVREEFDKLIRDGVPGDELRRTKKLLSGNMVLALEGMSARMMRATRNEFVHGRDVPVEETLARIEAVTPAQVQEMALRILAEDRITTTAIGPF
ncbi:MAG TPA: pitrilysin family protein [Fimbriimonadaceae bacterium]|nr:pitrilysin family protein [Fimbriimonadaceae bacterium]